MKIQPVLPVVVHRSRHSPDRTLIISASFIAGFLIGIPITYSLLYLPIFFDSAFQSSSIPKRTLSPLINDDRRYSPSDIPNLSSGDAEREKLAGIRSKIVARGDLPFSSLGHPIGPSKSLQRKIEKFGHTQSKSSMKRLPVFSSLLVKKHYPPTMDLFFNRSRNKEFVPSNETFLRFQDIVDGVLWSPLAEKLVPRGFDEYDFELWRRFLNTTEVLKLEEGCGRMQNRLITLADGGKSCCRYRHNNDQIQGEIFSFYLSRLLNIKNLPPSALALADGRIKRWSSAASQIALAQWSSERPVVLTQFIDSLQPAFIPKQFQESGKRRLHPISKDLFNMTSTDISELVQWSDLIIFDFLTGNLDRVLNNMFNERWNSEMMRQPTHNLAKTPEGLLLFLDNESGLLHGYRLLEKYDHFHKSLLDSLCIFKRDTIEALEKLHDGDIAHMLKRAFLESDPGMTEWLPFLPERSIKTLKERIGYVREHIRTCKSKFEPISNVSKNLTIHQ